MIIFFCAHHLTLPHFSRAHDDSCFLFHLRGHFISHDVDGNIGAHNCFFLYDGHAAIVRRPAALLRHIAAHFEAAMRGFFDGPPKTSH